MAKKLPRQKLASRAALAIDNGEADIARKLAAYLIEQGATDEVNSLARDILQLRADQDGIVEVTAVTSHPLSETMKAEIEQMVHGTQKNAKSVIINERLDQEVIGGVRLEFANALLDSTVDARLNSLRDKVIA
jgi:F-type H+-transporting ATPase subunit delta